ncbi:MAG: hypothetical protein FJ216_02795 [Ignavibacteria bacterium]|nr:hypothetical protein [Ignavibacteria bacterium]
MQKKNYPLILLIIFLTNALNAQNFSGNESNLEIIDKLTDKAAESIFNFIIEKGKEKKYYLGFGKESDKTDYLNSKIKTKFADYKIISGEYSGTADYNFFFDTIEIKVRYTDIYTKNIIGSKYVKRDIMVHLKGKISDAANDTNLLIFNSKKVYKDEFDYDNIYAIDKSRYGFTTAAVPEQSFFNKILIPAIIVTATAAIIAAFFFVRSK